MVKKIGVLALQGDFAEHIAVFNTLGEEAFEIRHPEQVAKADALVIPGGESTAVAKLESFLHARSTGKHGMFATIKDHIIAGMPTWGTCMGSIVLAKHIEGSGQGRIGLMNITVRRNAFGPQKFSSEKDIVIPAIGVDPFPGIFIRAPLYIDAGSTVEVLSKIDGGFVMARENNMLVTAFHPEMTNDMRVHEYFLSMLN